MSTEMPKLELGISIIDDPHRQIIGKIDEIQLLIGYGHNWMIVHSAIEELSELSEKHLAVEAALMQLFALPAYHEHEELHQHFRHELSSIYSKSLHGGDISEQLEPFKEWVINHMQVADRRDYGDFILGIERLANNEATATNRRLSN